MPAIITTGVGAFVVSFGDAKAISRDRLASNRSPLAATLPGHVACCAGEEGESLARPLAIRLG
jgi:hypothetical protein